MQQLGYANSELAIPHVRPLLRFMKRYPVDLVELETPSPGAWAIGICAKIAGIKVISHYRTDVPTYTKMLVKAKWMRLRPATDAHLYQFTRPVVSPKCEDYKKILIRDIHIPEKTCRSSRAEFRSRSSARNTAAEASGKIRRNGQSALCIRRRISGKEHSVPGKSGNRLGLRKKNSGAELMFVGDGWYLEELRGHFKTAPPVHFAGNQAGTPRRALRGRGLLSFSRARRDTFGNVVVEALASGTPAIVTDRGGPQDIIRGKLRIHSAFRRDGPLARPARRLHPHENGTHRGIRKPPHAMHSAAARTTRSNAPRRDNGNSSQASAAAFTKNEPGGSGAQTLVPEAQGSVPMALSP